MFGRGYVTNGVIDVQWVPTGKQHADLMTKILTAGVTNTHTRALGLLKGRIKDEGNLVKSEDRVTCDHGEKGSIKGG